MGLLVFACLSAFVGCRYFGSLDITVHTRTSDFRDISLIIKNNETKSLTDVTITISPMDSGNEYYYNMPKITAKSSEEITLSEFKDDGGNSFEGTIGKLKIDCDQGHWESNSNQ